MTDTKTPLPPQERFPSGMTLLRDISTLAAYGAAVTWIVRSNTLNTSTSFPFLFMPSVFVMGIGILLFPLLNLVMIIASVVFALATRPRPSALPIFYGLIVMIFFVEESCHLRWLIALAISSIVILAETIMRSLGTNQKISAVLCVAIAGATYFILLCALASASV